MQTTEMLGLKNVESSVLAREATKILLEKKGIDVKLYDVRQNSSVTDFYINVTGRSTTQVGSLVDDLLFLIGERGREALRVEGRKGKSWLLVDYGDVIINVFDRQSREYYSFDRHFDVSAKVDISDLVKEVDAKFDNNNKKDI